MIDTIYRFDRPTFEEYYEKYLFKPKRSEIFTNLCLLTAFSIICPLIIYATSLILIKIPTWILAIVMGFEFAFGIFAILITVFKIVKDTKSIYHDYRNIKNWYKQLEAVKIFRLVIDVDKFLFYSDDNLEAYKWSAFNSYAITETIIYLNSTNSTSAFYIAKASISEADFEKIKAFVVEKVLIKSETEEE